MWLMVCTEVDQPLSVQCCHRLPGREKMFVWPYIIQEVCSSEPEAPLCSLILPDRSILVHISWSVLVIEVILFSQHFYLNRTDCEMHNRRPCKIPLHFTPWVLGWEKCPNPIGQIAVPRLEDTWKWSLYFSKKNERYWDTTISGSLHGSLRISQTPPVPGSSSPKAGPA